MSEPVADQNTVAASAEPQPIVARAGSYYRSRRYIMVVAIIGFALFFAYDGWYRYPRNNARIDEVTKALNETKDDEQKKKLDEEMRSLGAKTEPFDIFLQKVLALSLPFVAIGYLAFFLRRSRGEVVLNGDVLTVPGHPPVGIDEIRSIDNRKWKKKGIAYFTYASAGQERTITLDDFIYDQTPVDDIYAVIAKRHNLTDAAPGLHAIGASAQSA